MGYYETYCQLCGASPAIARIRTPGEPEEASWDYYGQGFVEAHLDSLCGKESVSGCHALVNGEVRTRDDDGPDDFDGGEHIAAVACISGQGYSGWRIGLEEMKGCRAIQCLVQKTEGWETEEGDEEWERDGEYFLSGCGDGSADEGPLQDLTPVRHGLTEVWPFNTTDGDDEAPIPFHPTCFQIFSKISLERLGKIDVHGLWWLRTLEVDYDHRDSFPRHPAIRNGREQWWYHEPGNEWLVANPVEIPGFKLLLDSCMQEFQWCHPPKKIPYDVNQGVFNFKFKDGWDTYPTTYALPPPFACHSTDYFARLPQELLVMVINQLSSTDVASLRLVTPAVRQLPVILFRGLLLREAPWLWEVREMAINTTNWYKLWCKLRISWGELKGLKNRRRIWKDVNEVVRRIEHYREKGEIVDGSQSDDE